MGIPSGTRLGRYEIRSKIGEGGMGEVYLAQDTKLDRKVALKILPEEVAANQDRMRRFVQEAKTASALNHPNIITIYEIEQVDSVHFMAIEFIDGQTLREHMQTAPMKLSEVLNVAAQVASALVAAHVAGIVHRDIKRENIMLRHDGIAKVLDFGLAKLTERLPPDSVDTEALTRAAVNTEPGVVMGTLIYMSPEQARGMPVDARTDIFSLGVVLYEMVAGCLPFAGSTSSEVMASILSEKEPQPLARYSRDVPAELERIVSKALRKDREQRYQTTKDLLLDLQSLKQELEFERKLERSVPPRAEAGAATSQAAEPTVRVLPSRASTKGELVPASSARTVPVSSVEYVVSGIAQHKRGAAIVLSVLLLAAIGIGYWLFIHRPSNVTTIESIAVLPFANTSGDPNTEYLSDGISEALINSLTELQQLRVVARATAFRYKGREADPQTVGRDLNVRAVLMGRVRQMGDTLNVQVDLVDATTGAQLWGQEYERKISDVLSVKQNIAREVTEKLKLRLSGEDQHRITRRDTTNGEAYQLYLQGQYLWYRWDDKSLEFYQRATEKDPNYALAHIGIAESYLHLMAKNRVSVEEGIPKARAAITRALELDETLAEARNAVAEIEYQFEYDWPGAERDFKRAIALNPNVAQIRLAYGWYLMTAGRFDEALPQMRRAQELDSHNYLVNGAIGQLFYYMREYDRSLEYYLDLRVHDPNGQRFPRAIGEIYEQKKMYAEAVENYLAAMEKGGELKPEEVQRLKEIFKHSGWQGYLQAMRVRREEMAPSEPSSFTARFYARLGDKERAFAWLEKAINERDASVLRLKIDPAFDSIRSDPRYAKLLQRMNLTQ